MRRILPLVCLYWFAVALLAEEQGVKPQEYLPPIVRELHFPVEDEVEVPVKTDQERKKDALGVTTESLTEDIGALREAVERARKAIREKNIEGIDANWEQNDANRGTANNIERQKIGKEVPSVRLGSNDLAIQQYSDGSYDVTARVRNGQAVMVYSELLYLIGKSWDDQQVINRNQLINLHLKDQPWQEVLTSLLGQSGLAWTEEEDGDRSKIVIYPVRSHPRPTEKLRLLALDAWDKASRQRDNAVAAHAMYQRARQYYDSGKYTAAIQTFFDVSDTFSELANVNDSVRHWVKEAQLGVGDTMMELGQYREARAVYLNYLSLVLEHEDVPSEVYIKAAKASEQYGIEQNDELAIEKAEDILDNMLLKYKNDKRAHNNVVRAHYILGVLMIRKREFRVALNYFNAFKQESGGNHKLDFYLAECEYEIGVEENGRNNFTNSDIHFTNAQTLYRSVADDYADNKSDPLIKEPLEHIYENSYYRVGECFLKLHDPRFPEALAAFLRAREAFPDSNFLDAQVLIKIAHCYSELSADDESISYILQMLKSESMDKPALRLQIDELLTDIQSGLGEYQGHAKAKALFYIAQGRYRIAQQDQYDTSKIKVALESYERVLQNGPDAALRDAARLGLARSAILAKDEEYAESQLQELLRDSTVSARDRAYASQLLGRYYREQGKYKKAIEAFQGNVTE